MIVLQAVSKEKERFYVDTIQKTTYLIIHTMKHHYDIGRLGNYSQLKFWADEIHWLKDTLKDEEKIEFRQRILLSSLSWEFEVTKDLLMWIFIEVSKATIYFTIKIGTPYCSLKIMNKGF